MNLSASFSFVVVVLSVVQLFGQSAADFDTAKLAHFEKLVRPALSSIALNATQLIARPMAV